MPRGPGCTGRLHRRRRWHRTFYTPAVLLHLQNTKATRVYPAPPTADGTPHMRKVPTRKRHRTALCAAISHPYLPRAVPAYTSTPRVYTPSTRTSTLFFYREYNILVQHQGVLHVRAARAPLELYFNSVPRYNPRNPHPSSFSCTFLKCFTPSPEIRHILFATIRYPGCYEIYLPEGSMTWQRTNPGGSLAAPDTSTCTSYSLVSVSRRPSGDLMLNLLVLIYGIIVPS